MKTRTWLALLALLVATAGCEPERGKPPARGGRNPVVAEGDCRARASMPFKSSGPTPDGPGFYRFSSTVNGSVTCSRRMFQVKVTVVFHHQTNGSYRGAVSGRDQVCHNALFCDGEAFYNRTRLNCNIIYNYDDYGQVTGWYIAERGGPQIRFDSVDGRHHKGSSHRPREAGCR